MYTVEFETDSIIITSMDTTGQFSDVEVIIGEDNHVYIRQYDEDVEAYEMVIMEYKQFMQIFAAMKSPEGTYTLEIEYNDSN
jgi:hypothetical protein